MTTKMVTPRRGLLKLVDMPGKGRGLITTKPIPDGTVIEAAPVVRMRKVDTLYTKTVLSQYPFLWDEPPYVQAFGLGYVALLNHSDTPNCRVESDIEDQVLRVFSIRDIAAGEELVWNYGVDPWFDVSS